MSIRGSPRRSGLWPVLVALSAAPGLAWDSPGDGLAGRSAATRSAVEDAAQIRGRILGGGLCPTDSASQPCEDRPLFAVTVVLRNRQGEQIDRATTNVDGRFSFRPGPGTYAIRPEQVDGLGSPHRALVTVRPRHGSRVRFEFRAAAGPGVVGQATQSPTCPVQRVGEECVAPLRGARIRVEDASGSTVMSSVTGGNGFYAFSLEPGSYRLVGEPMDGPFPTPPEPVEFAVTERDTGPRWIPLDYDTGIR